MKDKANFLKLNYKEFCAYMKRYERETSKKESKKINKLAYKRVFDNNGNRIKYD